VTSGFSPWCHSRSGRPDERFACDGYEVPATGVKVAGSRRANETSRQRLESVPSVASRALKGRVGDSQTGLESHRTASSLEDR
jgi:hypothetical protein